MDSLEVSTVAGIDAAGSGNTSPCRMTGVTLPPGDTPPCRMTGVTLHHVKSLRSFYMGDSHPDRTPP